MPILVVERGNDKGESLKIEPGLTYVFGRESGPAIITMSDNLMSRSHFEIRSRGDAYTVTDLGSTNGTFLNDERIESSQLNFGDKIQVGDTILSFLSDKREGLVGKTVGGYELLERVGRGGMGTVFKATQLSLNRQVAFKVLSSRLLEDPKFIAQFKSEARAAGQLNYPNIVQVYDVGKDRRLHFFSMEFMDGGSLQDKIGKDGKLPWEECLDVLIQAAKALIFAEMRKIVHRDVKPDNLMLTSDGQIKLADLGLARQQDAKIEEEGIYGTPHFISPEQAQGKEVDHRADLYSLGATAYRLLSGRTPFLGANVSEIISKQISEDPPPLKQFVSDCPEELAAVVSTLMKKDPEGRYDSAQVLLEELEKIRLKYHLKAHSVGGGGKGVLIAVTVALLAVAGLIGFLLTRNGEPNGNGTPPPIGPIGPAVTTQKPEIIVKEDDAAKARGDYFMLKAKEPAGGSVATTWQTQRAAWDSLVKEYDSVAKKYPETEFGKKAGTRSTEIRRIVEQKSREEEERQKAAKTAWESLKARVETALAEKRFARALRFAEEGAKAPEVKQARLVLNDAAEQIDKWLSQSQGSIEARFLDAWQKCFSEAKAEQEAGRYAVAAAKVREFLQRAAEDETGKLETRAPFGKALSDAAEYTEALKRELAAKLSAAVKEDAESFYRAYRGIRGIGEPPTPVFDFRFENAADALAPLLAPEGLKTDIFKSRVEEKIASLGSMGRLMDELVRRLNDGDVAIGKFDLPDGLGGGRDVKKVELNREATPIATRDGVSIKKDIKIGGRIAKVKENIPWERFSAEELWTYVFLEGRRWALTAQEHAAAARFLAETGTQRGLEAEIAAAGAALSPEEKVQLEAELAAIREYTDVRESRKTRPAAEWDLAVSKFVQSHSLTDFFVLVYFDTPGDKPLVPEADVKLWIAAKLKPIDGD